MTDDINTQTLVGYLDAAVPIWQAEGVTKEQAETVSREIMSAYIYLNNQNDKYYSNIIINKLQEIHIVTTVDNEEHKYDLCPVGNKFIIKFKNDITYTETIYCIMNAAAKLNL